MTASVVVLDYGSGNVRSVVRALEHVGASVELTADPARAAGADGLLVPGVGNFHACIAGLRAARGEELVRARVARDAPVLGICVGLQVLYDGSTEHSAAAEPGMGIWRGRVERLPADVVPHMGWSPVRPGPGSALFEGLADERFYFVHSYAVPDDGERASRVVSTAEHGHRFVAAVEDGPLSATQFHPEKSGDAGLRLLKNWVRSL
ncbi:imidazole glycerol phosphate synthase subunit HisH [Marihabitans asiaticum]|uniref:Imidazole glycerol phosphate synthase subunit HisH n=1 Tax=Marihabitans asiaticum TaxID=415218 RepID=A0A560WAH3_9MICO|nr:imidazole glycerol phosphate synthase subunit HisH [Marihabitans asiaticum]TWD14633.1 imidazole glycerol phosphate synthase subunit HisH [Marihabitans asiaticum]